jgi:hypothetical protein
MRSTVTCAVVALGFASLTGVVAAAEDEQAPEAPVVSSQEYPDDDNEHDGVGSYGTVLIDSASNDVVTYRYQWLGGAPKTLRASEPGAAVSLRWMPEKSGTTYLQVQAIDSADNVSARTTYYIRVRDGRAAVTRWNPGDDAGAVVGDGVRLDAIGPSGTESPSAAAFDGTDDAQVTLGSAVDTAKSFSVDAWVRPDSLGGDAMTAVGQSGFSLGTVHDSSGASRWSFALPTASGGTTRVTGGAPEEGEWAHLVGVYDTEQHTARLYVDGKAAGAAESTDAASGTGDLRLGAGGEGGHWSGLLTDVNVWDRVFVPGEIASAALRKPIRQGYWDLETAADGKSPAYAGGEPLTLGGDASIYAATDDCTWNPECTPVSLYPMVGNGDLWLDGDGDYATTPTALTPSDGGFSASVHVRLDPDTATHDMTVLSQPGAHTDLFTLRYVASSQTWQAEVAHEDRAGAPTTEVSATIGVAGASDDQFVAVVYDEAADQLRLYVDNTYAADTADVPGVTPFAPIGTLQVGRTSTPEGGMDYLEGEIDELHTYAGVLNETRLAALRLGGTDA